MGAIQKRYVELVRKRSLFKKRNLLKTNHIESDIIKKQESSTQLKGSPDSDEAHDDCGHAKTKSNAKICKRDE